MAISFKGAQFPPEVILIGVRWYLAYPLSTRHVEELMEERGVNVDHSTVTPDGPLLVRTVVFDTFALLDQRAGPFSHVLVRVGRIELVRHHDEGGGDVGRRGVEHRGRRAIRAKSDDFIVM